MLKSLQASSRFGPTVFWITLALPVFASSVLIAQSTWPSFRNGGSSITTAKNIPTRWSAEEGLAWRSEIPGYGQSSPVVWNESVFLTSSNGPFQEECFVHCFDLRDGKKKWSTKIDATTQVENYFRNSRAAPTCVVDQDTVISFFASGDVTAMNHQGAILWSLSLFKRFGQVDNERGTASSLAQSKDKVFALIDHHGPSYLVAINKKDGRVAWKKDRGKREPSWSSPVVAKWKNRQLVISSSSGSVDTYDEKTGKEIWSIGGFKGNLIPSASFNNGSVFVGSTQMFHGDLDSQEVAKSNCRIDLIGKGQGTGFELKWGAQQANSYYSSPICFGEYVYYVNKSGVLFCVDRKTGERLFAKRIGNPCWSSAIGVTTDNGKKLVYFFMKNGSSVVIKPGKAYEQLARNRLWDRDEMTRVADAAERLRKQNIVPPDQAKPKTGPEKFLAGMPEKSLHKMFSYGDPIVYAAVIVDGSILLRTGQHLYCVRK